MSRQSPFAPLSAHPLGRAGFAVQTPPRRFAPLIILIAVFTACGSGNSSGSLGQPSAASLTGTPTTATNATLSPAASRPSPTIPPATPVVTPTLGAPPPAAILPSSPQPERATSPSPAVLPATSTTARETVPPSIAFADAAHGWASDGGTILGTTDGGANWSVQYRGTTPIAQLVALGRDVARAATSAGLRGTTDGGQHWVLLSDSTLSFRAVDFPTPELGWAITGGSPEPSDVLSPSLPLQGGQLQLTTDGGRHWTAQAGPNFGGPDDAQSLCFGDSLDGWLGTRASIWQFTAPGSVRLGGWHFLWHGPLYGEDWRVWLACAGPTDVWALFVGEGVAMNHKPYVLYRSTDAGQTWTAMLAEAYTGPSYPTVRPVAPEPGSYPGPLVVVSRQIVFFLGRTPPATTPFTLARTVDGGQTWQERPVPVIGQASQGSPAMTFVDATHGWIAVGEWGATREDIFATTDGGNSWHRQYP